MGPPSADSRIVPFPAEATPSLPPGAKATARIHVKMFCAMSVSSVHVSP